MSHAYPLLLWESFDRHVPDDACCEHISGSALSIQNGELTSKETCRAHFLLAQRAARVEAGFYTGLETCVFALLIRVVDATHYYAVQVDLSRKMFQLWQRDGAQKDLIAEVAIPFYEPTTGFQANVMVEDDGQNLRCHYLDYQIVLNTKTLGHVFDNLYADAQQVGVMGIGEGGARCRYVRAWSEVPQWDGCECVEPMWGAQHIWTKVHQRFVGKHDRTYWGWCTVWGGVQVRWYDHQTQCFGPIETVFVYPGKVQWAYDDHHPPGVYVHEDGHIWVWIQSHKSKDPFLLLRSKSAEDIGAWDAPLNMNDQEDAPAGGVYPRAYQVSCGDVVLFHRVGGSGDGEWHIRRSKDGGHTWDNTKIINNQEGHVYQFIRQNPQNPDHIVLVGNHKDITTRPNSWRRLYVWETRDGGHSFQTVREGRLISLPAKRSDLEPIFTDAEHQLFVTGFAIGKNGKPLILAGYKDDPEHEICAFSWQEDHWHKSTVCKNLAWPGAGSYKENVWRPSGGDVNPINTGEICIAVAVDGVHEIQRWISADGMQWTKKDEMTQNSVVKNFRPTYIENPHPDDWQIMWHSGEYYGTTEAIGQGRHFDRFDDVMLVNERLCKTLKKK